MAGDNLLLISFITNDCRTIGTCSLYANATEAGINAKLLYIKSDVPLNVEAIKLFLRQNKFAYVGVSLATHEFYISIELTRIIKEALPEVFIIWGGIHPTCMPEECLQVVDCLCIGESEKVLIDLIRTHSLGQDISVLQGVATRNNDKTVINQAGFVSDINSIHFPYYDFDNFFVSDMNSNYVRNFSLEEYARYSRHGGDGYTLITMRSCPHNCSYCINSYLNKLYKGKGKIRRRTVGKAMEEIKFAIDRIPSIRFINFMDDHFLTSTKWLNEFCDVYASEIQLPFIIRSTPEALTEARLVNLKKAGLAVVQVGIQSGSEETHRTIFNRHFNRRRILEAANLLNKYKIKGMFDFIIGNEFESDYQKEQTIRLMMDLPKPFIANIFHIIVFPKTDIVDFYKKNNITPRINPYHTNYNDFNNNDFFAKLALLVPHINNDLVENFLESRSDTNIIDRLDAELRNIQNNHSIMFSEYDV